MKPSVIFSLAIALVFAFVAVGAARYFGLFTRSAPPPAKEQPREQPPRILAARQVLFDGMTLQASHVYVREVRPEEMDFYKANTSKFLPAFPEAATLRVMARTIEADRPLLNEYLEDPSMPDPINRRLAKGMRAVHLSLPKDAVSGGLIQVGEHVDVYLTTQVVPPGRPGGAVQTACLARELKVIVKRDSLWTNLAADPENRPIHVTLQANPYRAALLEFAKLKGSITLVPTPAPQEGKTGRGSILAASANDFDGEEARVDAFLKGSEPISDRDLEKIFKVVPPGRPVRIERYSGLTYRGATSFDGPVGEQAAFGFQFRAPDAKK